MTRKLVPPASVKDESGAYRKPDAPTPIPRPSAEEMSLDSISDKLLQVLYRETRSLMEETSLGDQLSRENKTALVNYIKLVKELQDKEKDTLDNLSDEELAKLAEGRNDQ